MHTAKLFKNGRSQAVRLPKNFRLKGDEVAISHMGEAIVLQPLRHSWLEIYHAMATLPEFMEDREDFLPEEREQL
ncbi:MAG: AbrB/MazE/SpoVT family DNA-binding domain-containing protein [Gammaproteobacteria bacterium]|nr:MAG: AbrB/MazE/SpoVT family DNA-binding domain-containing protein [Gammaproteobacteria bacterium]